MSTSGPITLAFSNTYFFYLRGWRGMNIDAMPGCMDPFRRRRPEDINLECALAEDRRRPHLLSVRRAGAERLLAGAVRVQGGQGHFPADRPSRCRRGAADVLDYHLPAGPLDRFPERGCGGPRPRILRSNDWSKYRPRSSSPRTRTSSSRKTLGRSGVVRLLASPGLPALRQRGAYPVFLADELCLVPGADRFFA